MGLSLVLISAQQNAKIPVIFGGNPSFVHVVTVVYTSSKSWILEQFSIFW